MYLWNINELVKELKAHKVTNREIWIYRLLGPLLSICAAALFTVLLFSHHFVANIFDYLISGSDVRMSFYNWIGIITGLATVAISVIGFGLCYQTNKHGDNKNFATRMTCLSFPINFHMTVYVLAFLSVLLIIAFAIVTGKISFFKTEILALAKLDNTFGTALHKALSGTPLQNTIEQAQAQKGILSSLLNVPTSLPNFPAILKKIDTLIRAVRASILIIYPIVACLPPILALCHYLLIRRMLKKIAY